jgi:arylsulfatase A-like enzyme
MTGQAPARLHLTNYLPGRPDADSQKLLQPTIEGQLPLEEITIAELLRDAGYATGAFGKWHLGGKGFGPEVQGFEAVVSPSANTTPTADEGGKGEYAITDAAERFMEQNKDRPFFCYVAHNNPHIPLAARSELVEENREAFNPTYAAMIETLDDSVGQLVETIDRLGLSERTVFIFTSDNGGLHVLESPGTPSTHNSLFRAGKGFLYEGGLRVPLIIRAPEIVASGGICDTPVVLTDLMPTILEMAGIEAATTVGPLDGLSFVSLLRGNSMPNRTLFWHFPNYTNQGGRPAGAVRQGRWKLVEQYEDGTIELFDLESDPGETDNLASSHPDRADDLRRKLHLWRDSVGAQMPTPNPRVDGALHRTLYVDRDPSRLIAGPTAAATEAQWKGWREAMNSAVRGRAPKVTAPSGDIRLHAKDARTHATSLRYEPQPHKNVLGYWTNKDDWAEWEFAVPTAGKYEVELQQGCDQGSGGAEVDVIVAGQTLAFTVRETGHFQQMIQMTIGTVELTPGAATLAVKPRVKPGPAVMDLRRIVLRPVK